MVKTLEGDRYALCEKHVIVSFCCSYQVYRYLAGCFGLISCRHYLDNLSFKQIGKLLKMNLYTVHSRYKRTLKSLQRELERSRYEAK